MGQQYDDREWRRRQQERGDPMNDERGSDEQYRNEREYPRRQNENREGQRYSYSDTESYIVPGPYSGVGPRDYTRTDERIYEEVCDRLAQHGQIDASDIEVKVENGEVTLDGTAPDRRQKRLAENVIESIWGVNDVHNHLRVRDRQGRMQSDREPERERNQDRQQESTTVTPSPAELGGSTVTTPPGDLGPGGTIMGMPITGIASQAAAVDLGYTDTETEIDDEKDTHDTGQDLHIVDLNRHEPGMSMHEDTGSPTGMMSELKDHLHEGMDVMSADGEMVGKVKAVRESDFLLDRPMARDVYVPYDSAEISGERVRLTIPSDQISRMDWPSPDLFGS